MKKELTKHELIKEFLELWQKQFAYIARDNNAMSDSLRAFYNINKTFVSESGKNDVKASADANVFLDVLNELNKFTSGSFKSSERYNEVESTTFKKGQRSKKANG